MYKSKLIFIISNLIFISYIAFKQIAQIIEKLWFRLSFILSLIIPKIILFFIYSFVLTPTALLYRSIRNDRLMLNNKLKSTFKERNKVYKHIDFEKMW